MNAYQFEISCWGCGGELEPVTSGVVFNGNETNSVAVCTECGSEWGIHLRLVAFHAKQTLIGKTRSRVAECGTDSGYRKHCQKKETPCQRCRDAHAAADRERRAVAR